MKFLLEDLPRMLLTTDHPVAIPQLRAHLGNTPWVTEGGWGASLTGTCSQPHPPFSNIQIWGIYQQSLGSSHSTALGSEGTVKVPPEPLSPRALPGTALLSSKQRGLQFPAPE